MNTVTLQKIKIIGNNKHKKSVIQKIQSIGSLHIEQATQKNMTADSPLEGIDEISLLLLKLNYIAQEANLTEDYTIQKMADKAKVVTEAKKFLQENLSEVEKNRKLHEKKKEELDDKKSKYNNLAKIDIEIIKESSKKVNTWLYTSKQKHVLKNLGAQTITKVIKEKDKYYYKINFLKSKEEEIQKKLGRTPLKKINISYVKENTVKTKKELTDQIQKLTKELEQLNSKLHHKIKSKKTKLLYLITTLKNYREQYNISTRFQKSKNHFLIQGYIEEEDITQLKSELKNVTIIKSKPEKAPTKLKNKGLAKSFEPITKMFSIPTYGSVDPTFLTTIFYPLFFGLMFSDVGYGLVMFGLLPFINKYLEKPFKKQVSTILIASALSTIFFGLVFGSFFGNLIQIPALYMPTFDATLQLLLLSLIIGFIHINIGVSLNIYQAYKKKDVNKAIYEVTPALLIQIIAILLYFGQFIISSVLALILLTLLFKHKNVFGLLDISDLFGTWFSYARLLALSLATAGVALAVNVIADQFLQLGVIGIILAIITIIIGHAFNFVINAIGCAIHSIRLHYVEFFSFFFEGGGKLFQPFKIQSRNNTT